ncbi:hypothetical protein [Paractinoplanes hotanensis]|uniref:Lipoprotein n=1 Tax=Paractinoplanes hotanensis TaxID=2906497 RepID=A0ABT0YDZ4_9ACTN|nr:hypothetical protein [Actinoplanes hotanensis]MCM4084269.1 hypothetical protein [Actinoplanes hotanensis]
MNEMKMLLDSAVAIEDGPVDPAADLVRGRRRLHKRLRTRAWACAAGLAVVAAATGAVVTNGLADPAAPRAATAPPASLTHSATTGTSPRTQLPAIELVAYTGKQVPGYTVKSVPEGWEIQGGSNTVLTLAPQGFKNQDVNDWVGKIVIMLESKEAAGDDRPITEEDLKAWGMEGSDLAQTTAKVTVNGKDGSISRPVNADRTSTVSVSFPDTKGHHVVAQGPASLGWTDAQWVEFAEGVTVLRNAEQGAG